MSDNILESITKSLSPELIGRAATAFGESPVATSKAATAAIPAILGGLVRGSNNRNVMTQVFDLLRSPSASEGLLAKPQVILEEAASPRPGAGSSDLGGSLLATVFGARLRTVTDAIGQYAGLRSGSASSLLSVLGTVVAAVLGQKVKDETMDVGTFTRLVADQKENVISALPPGLSGVLGLATPLHERVRQNVNAATQKAESQKGFSWTWPLAGVAALAAIWLLARGGEERMVDSAMGMLDTAVTSAAATASNAASSMDGLVQRTLPGGGAISIPREGTEQALLDLLDDSTRQTDSLWFKLDRVSFESGAAALRPESREQLQNLAAILKAYPRLTLEIAGFTDNTGDAESNLKLSQERADAVKRELEVLGISPVRVLANGYGQDNPVADNSTAQGRAENRRIALRVSSR